MSRFVEGQDRNQVTLLPDCLDDYIAEDNSVRVMDAFIGELDMVALGFEGATPAATGRPSYHPAVMLKVYLYGYLNRIASSRRLEGECQRNVELMWLTGRLAPDFKTIADFRRDNSAGIRNVCRRFVMLCRELKLFSQAVVAIDGSKFKAVNSRDCNFTNGKVDKRQQQVEENIQRYLSALETADRTERAGLGGKTVQIKEKIAQLRQQLRALDVVREQLKEQPDGQLSTTDPDARSMATGSKSSGAVAYNVQVAVDTRNHLIVAHEVTNAISDRALLSPMAQAAREAMGKKELLAIADRGYFSGPQIKACADAGIAAVLPKPMTSNAKSEGRFDKADFIYIKQDDEYKCPAGQRAKFRMATQEKGMIIHRYWSSACPRCPMKEQCTPSDYRRISRWEHEEVLDAVQHRLDQSPKSMSIRRRTVEHVFGTLKGWMGHTHFLTRRLPHVGAEMSLNVLAYNFKRVLSILGFEAMMKAMRLAGA